MRTALASALRRSTFRHFPIEDHHRPTRVNTKPCPSHPSRTSVSASGLSRPSAPRGASARGRRVAVIPRSTSGEPRRVRGRQAPPRIAVGVRHSMRVTRLRDLVEISPDLWSPSAVGARRRRRAGECLQGAPARVAALPSVLAARRGRREPRRAIFDGIAAHGGLDDVARVTRCVCDRDQEFISLVPEAGMMMAESAFRCRRWRRARRVRGPRGAPRRATHRARARSRETGGAREPGVSDGEGKRRPLHLSRRRQAEQVLHRHVHQGARLAPPRHVHLLVSHRGRPRGVQGDASRMWEGEEESDVALMDEFAFASRSSSAAATDAW